MEENFKWKVNGRLFSLVILWRFTFFRWFLSFLPSTPPFSFDIRDNGLVDLRQSRSRFGAGLSVSSDARSSVVVNRNRFLERLFRLSSSFVWIDLYWAGGTSVFLSSFCLFHLVKLSLLGPLFFFPFLDFNDLKLLLSIVSFLFIFVNHLFVRFLHDG